MSMGAGIKALVFAAAVAAAGVIGCGSSSSGGDAGGGTSGGTAGATGTGGGAAGTTGTGGGAAGTTGTGGAGGAPATSGVTGTKRLDALTTAEKQKICDFAAAQFGGYGKTVDCGGGTTLTSDPDQASCVAGAPTSCAMTVSQYETCIHGISCSDPLPAACAPLLQCS
ncbi:MAG TPA: hypothetical protein VIF57_21390 [Polyangia bacterium]|jgi:hypothetical protein